MRFDLLAFRFALIFRRGKEILFNLEFFFHLFDQIVYRCIIEFFML